VVAHSTTPVLVIPQLQLVNGHACATTLREAF
jgi:hypothetical protein